MVALLAPPLPQEEATPCIKDPSWWMHGVDTPAGRLCGQRLTRRRTCLIKRGRPRLPQIGWYRSHGLLTGCDPDDGGC